MSDTKASPLPGVEVERAVLEARGIVSVLSRCTTANAFGYSIEVVRLARAVIALHEQLAESDGWARDFQKAAEQRTAEAIAAYFADRVSGGDEAADLIRSGAWRPTPAPPSREEKP